MLDELLHEHAPTRVVGQRRKSSSDIARSYQPDVSTTQTGHRFHDHVVAPDVPVQREEVYEAIHGSKPVIQPSAVVKATDHPADPHG